MASGECSSAISCGELASSEDQVYYSATPCQALAVQNDTTELAAHLHASPIRTGPIFGGNTPGGRQRGDAHA